MRIRRVDARPMTIFAPATAAGRAGVAVLRISGPQAAGAVVALAGELPPPRHAALRRLRHPASGDALDDALVLWFPAPASFTGEDVAELHLHGGRAVSAAVLGALAALPGLRPAEPGEFTRRAFDNGKLDLTAVEGLADLVAAESEAQRRQALRQLDGALGELYDGWRDVLLHSLARLEAEIDFPEEGLPEEIASRVKHNIEDIVNHISLHLDDHRRGERLREGVVVVILGAPNVGKSSLLNCLAGRDAAIVSHEAGTTRDVVEVHMDMGGYPVILADTAGLRETGGAVESEGVRRALARAADADLKMVVFDARNWPEMDPRTAALVDGDTLVVVNKGDLAPGSAAGAPEAQGPWWISCLTGTGLDALVAGLGGEIARRWSLEGGPALTRERHRAALEDCSAALGRCLEAGSRDSVAAELVAEDLRHAVTALGRITGRIDVEDLLDVIFAEFCIGK